MIFDYVEALKTWCAVKISLWGKRQNIVLRQGDVWWCSIGMNLGGEIFGKGQRFTRPVLIFKKITGDSCLGLPLTSKEKEGNWYVPIMLLNKKRWIVLSQARLFDGKRFTKKLGTMQYFDFRNVQERFHDFYCS